MALPSTTLNSKLSYKSKKKPTLTDLIKEPTEKDNEPYPQLRHSIKMVQSVGVLCTGTIERGGDSLS